MKIRLEKPAVNISKLVGGKNEKPRRGANYHPITLQIIQSTQSKCCKIKITSYNLFIKWFPTLHLNIIVPNVFNKRSLLEIQGKHFMSCF